MRKPTVYAPIYDLGLRKTAILDNVIHCSYSQRLNGLSTASITIPADDPKTVWLRPLHYVELWDNGIRIDLFRILPKETRRNPDGQTVTYELEHVLATLMDSVLYGYHEIGGTGTYTPEILSYILSHQNQAHWVVDDVQFDRQFQYSWENENLLGALLSVPKPFSDDYHWQWDTLTYPWKLHLKQMDPDLLGEIRYRTNLREVERVEDPTYLCTRLYALGMGEGVNQLKVRSVNPTGEDYIDSDTVGQYGIVSKIWVDRRYENEETLYEAARAQLEELKHPRVEYKVRAADLQRITNLELHKLQVGRKVRVYDMDLGIDYTNYITELSKPDVDHDPANIDITIANKKQDIAGTIADLSARTRISEVWSQGATSIDSHQMADNCDASNPVTIKFHLPPEAVHINKVLLNYDVEAFRAYSKSAASGGGASTTSSSGGSSSQTSSAASNHTHSVSNHSHTVSVGNHSHSVSGQTAASTGSHRHSLNGADTNSARHDTGVTHYHSMLSNSFSTYSGTHSHSVDGKTTTSAGGFSTTSASGGGQTSSASGSHAHSVSVPNHTHDINLPDHTHDLVYGIYNGPTPTSVQVRVDGNLVPGLELNETEVNITDYLERTTGISGGGRIVRGWHEVTITPNTLGRVQAAIHVQQFINSRGAVQL